MSQRSGGSCTCCTLANAFSGLNEIKIYIIWTSFQKLFQEVICRYFFCFSGILKTGLGFILCHIGSLSFLLVFHWKLHTIPDDSLEDGLKKYSNISCFVFILGFGVFIQQLFYFLLPSETDTHDEVSIILHHLMYLFVIIFWFIFVPKCYIKQNSNLSFYVSVYHQQPPPILPWQLPHNFDPKSVKLVVAGGSILQFDKAVILAISVLKNQ